LPGTSTSLWCRRKNNPSSGWITKRMELRSFCTFLKSGLGSSRLTDNRRSQVLGSFVGGLCGSLHSCDSSWHSCIVSRDNTNSSERRGLALCSYFASSERSVRDSSDLIFFDWPLRRVWRLCRAADWCAFL
jgi:hypothetical protein